MSHPYFRLHRLHIYAVFFLNLFTSVNIRSHGHRVRSCPTMAANDESLLENEHLQVSLLKMYQALFKIVGL